MVNHASTYFYKQKHKITCISYALSLKEQLASLSQVCGAKNALFG
jgi:hypothetical protein